MAKVNTLNGEVEESELIRRDGLVDNNVEHTTSVEYCLKDCPGQAHKSGVPDSPSHFCNLHVHRSAHVTLKKPVTMESAIGSFA